MLNRFYYVVESPDGDQFIASSEKMGDSIGISKVEWDRRQDEARAKLDSKLEAERKANWPIRLFAFRKMLRNKTLKNGVTFLAELEAKHAEDVLSDDAFEYIEMSDPVRASDPEMDEIASALKVSRAKWNEYLVELHGK